MQFIGKNRKKRPLKYDVFADATQQQQLQLQQQGMVGQPDPSLALHLAICTPSYFNNENDEVLRKWNQLQAFWGAGKGNISSGSNFCLSF